MKGIVGADTELQQESTCLYIEHRSIEVSQLTGISH